MGKAEERQHKQFMYTCSCHARVQEGTARCVRWEACACACGIASGLHHALVETHTSAHVGSRVVISMTSTVVEKRCVGSKKDVGRSAKAMELREECRDHSAATSGKGTDRGRDRGVLTCVHPLRTCSNASAHTTGRNTAWWCMTPGLCLPTYIHTPQHKDPNHGWGQTPLPWPPQWR